MKPVRCLWSVLSKLTLDYIILDSTLLSLHRVQVLRQRNAKSSFALSLKMTPME